MSLEKSENTRSRRRILWILIFGFFVAILWLFGFLNPRSYSFAYECYKAEKELDKHYAENRLLFNDLIPFLRNAPALDFYLDSGDSLTISFKDSTNERDEIFIDSIYQINSKSKRKYTLNDDGCLLSIKKDTIYSCDSNWIVYFNGHYKDRRIDFLLEYYGWNRKKFENLISRLKSLECKSFSCQDGNFILSYKTVLFEKKPSSLLVFYSHPDGHFDYIFTKNIEEYTWKAYVDQYEDNFYGIKYWRWI